DVGEGGRRGAGVAARSLRNLGRLTRGALVDVGQTVRVTPDERLPGLEEDTRPVVRDAPEEGVVRAVPSARSRREEIGGSARAVVEIEAPVGVARDERLVRAEEDVTAVGRVALEERAGSAV